MDESWRMKMGGLGVDPFFSIARKSMDDRIDAEDFADVFGGPPRTVLTRKLSGDFSRSDCFYDEIFQQSGLRSRPLPSSKSHGRNLPAFRIPSSGDGFYDGVFGSFSGRAGGTAKEGSKKSSVAKSKSRSNSSSVLTSEEVSPHYPPPPATSSDDTAFSSFTSRLRPLNVPSRSQKPESKKQNFPAFRQAGESFSVYENTPEKSDFYCKNSQFGRTESSRRASPETISLDPSSFRSKKLSMDDYGPSSPASSPVSTVNNEEYETEVKQRTTEDCPVEEEEEYEEDDEEMSSYVIEINSDRYDRNREEGGGGSDSNDMDEAIAWAKERSQRPETNKQTENSTEEDEIDSITREDEGKSEEEIEMEMKDEEIRIWLTGKETNIRLLLSTLHHVLWSNSGWHAIPLANLRDGSQVKRAYQKARLCLHPDKLQQRGALVMQKSVANRVFSVLQEAWAVYVTKEGLSS